MAKPEWGVKRTCMTCGARFYDMNHRPIVCPKCEAVQDLETPPKLRRSDRKKEPPKVVETKAPVEEEPLDTELETEEEEDDTDLIEDPSDLGEDENDLEEVKEHLELDDQD